MQYSDHRSIIVTPGQGHLGVNMIVVDQRLVGIGLGFGRIRSPPDGAIPGISSGRAIRPAAFIGR